MHPKIKKQLDRSSLNFEFYSRTLAELSQEQLNYHYDQRRWSIGEIIYHIYLSETMIIDSVMNFSFDIKNEKLGIRSQWNSFLINSFLNTSLKFKAPNSSLQDFPDSIRPESFLEHWTNKRTAFGEYVKAFNPEKLNFRVFRHPFAGKLTLTQTMGFMNYHMIHHERQIRRISRLKNFPKQD